MTDELTELRSRAAAVRALLVDAYASEDVGLISSETLVARLIAAQGERGDELRRARTAIAELRRLVDPALPWASTMGLVDVVARLIDERNRDARAEASMTARVVRGRLEGALEHLNMLILPEPDE